MDMGSWDLCDLSIDFSSFSLRRILDTNTNNTKYSY